MLCCCLGSHGETNNAIAAADVFAAAIRRFVAIAAVIIAATASTAAAAVIRFRASSEIFVVGDIGNRTANRTGRFGGFADLQQRALESDGIEHGACLLLIACFAILYDTGLYVLYGTMRGVCVCVPICVRAYIF